MELTAQQVGEWLIYDPSTGNFRWRKRVAQRAKAGMLAGSVNGAGYVKITVCGQPHQAHRLAWLLMTGGWPDRVVDHVDGNKINNAWPNLRSATRSQNAANRKPNANACIGLKGVSFRKKEGKFVAQICVNRKRMWLGLFSTADEAHAAYMKAAERAFGEFASDGRARRGR